MTMPFAAPHEFGAGTFRPCIGRAGVSWRENATALEIVRQSAGNSFSGQVMTRMYGPAVRCKGFFVDLVGDGSCINVSGLSLERCSGPSWISARVRSH
jgi:hypothetical protein